MKQSGGDIRASTEPGSGTTFKIYLPCVGGEGAIHIREETPLIRGGSKTILLVEDNGSLRQLAREMLEGLGYAVLDSGRPSEAVHLAERHRGPIALLVTDVVMPEVNGHVLAKTITAIRPGMKVLYTSGYSNHPSVERVELEAGYPLLEKPFARDDLAKRVRDLLDSSIS